MKHTSDAWRAHRSSADRMELLMMATSALAALAGFAVLFLSSFAGGLALLVLASMGYALGRGFEVLSEVVGAVGRWEESLKGGKAGTGRTGPVSGEG